MGISVYNQFLILYNNNSFAASNDNSAAAANTEFSEVHIPCINLTFHIVNELWILNSLLFALHLF